MITVDHLLRGWLPSQRWFASKGRTIARVYSRSAAVLRREEPRVEARMVTVEFADSGGPLRETYHVPLSYYRRTSDQLVHALLGDVDDPVTGQTRWVHDALRDRDATAVWLELFASKAELGDLGFHIEPDVDLPVGAFGDILSAEQSNSSLIYGETAILKLFRRVEPGINPDIEIHEALRPAGNPHLAPLLGHVTALWQEPGAGPDGPGGPARVSRPAGPADGGPYRSSLAMLQTFLSSASDGWSLATTSVRDLYGEGDLHPDEVGGDFASEAHRLGQATASVHADLARLMPTEVVGPDRLGRLASGMTARLTAACDVVPELTQHADALLTCYDALRGLDGTLRLQRVHGDFHLGQVLRTSQGWTLLDFEGEPARPLAQRRELDSPLRDVAGMLRSFDYAARHLLLDGAAEPQLNYRATEWSDRNRDAFCGGYAEQSGTDPREDPVLLRAFEADKAVYEAVYEARNRPSWLP
ncbi:MAG TPA: phosphotransferase, partial [Mycobacteriales bacterium]|nr:phosphotransferase [Mycobacteriales bacterium]